MRRARLRRSTTLASRELPGRDQSGRLGALEPAAEVEAALRRLLAGDRRGLALGLPRELRARELDAGAIVAGLAGVELALPRNDLTGRRVGVQGCEEVVADRDRGRRRGRGERDGCDGDRE